MLKGFLILVSAVILFSCNFENKKDKLNHIVYRNFDDSFQDSLQPFWYTHQAAHPDRFQIVKDSNNPDNDLFKVSLKKEDYVAKGFRSEIVLKSQDSFGYCNNYSFKFKFPSSFFKNESTQGVILLNQWHNVPYPGYTYKDQIVKVRVPFALMVEHKPDSSFQMKIHYGLRVNTLNEMVYAIWPGELKPDVWYTFENEIFWSMYGDGYSMPVIDNICFLEETSGKELCVLEGANMYHIRPHDYKMGLYWSPGHIHDRYILYDDFKMETQRTSYFSGNK